MKNLYNFLAKAVFVVILSYIYFYIKADLAFWDYLSYGFILGGYLMFIATPYFIRTTANKTVQEMPVYAVSFIYLIVQIICALYLSLHFKVTDSFNFNNYYLLQAIITGIYLIILFSILSVNVDTHSNLKKQYIDTEYIKEIKSELILLLDRTTNNIVKKNIENIIDLVMSSPSKSYDELVNIENNIIDEVNQLKDLIYSNANSENINACCIKIEKMINKRNSEIKLIQYKK